MKEFSAFLDLKRGKSWAHKISSGKYLTLQRPLLPAFPKHRVPGSWSLPWTPFRGWWRSATAAAPDLILIKVDGKCQFVVDSTNFQGFPGSSEVKASASNVRDPGSIPGSGRSPGGGNGNPLLSTPVFLPGESHGRRSLVGYNPRGCKESDTTEQLHLHQ